MKNLYIITITLLMTQFAFSQIVNIPDDNFKNALLNTNYVDTNNDGEIQISEVENVLMLNVYDQGILDLTGISAFTNLVELDCSNNALSTIDLSQNINLEILHAYNNQLSTINVTNNINLLGLDLRNNLLAELNLTQNTALRDLEFSNNMLTTIDLTNNINLKFLWCAFNQLTSLDLSNTKVIDLVTSNNNLHYLNVKNDYLFEHQPTWPNEWAFYVDNNPNLTQVCVDELELDYIQGLVNLSTTATSNCLLGMTNQDLSINMRLYPNPAKGILNIESETPFKTMVIYDMNGRLLQTVAPINPKLQFQLDVSGLSRGIYFLEIQSGSGQQTHKFIKN